MIQERISMKSARRNFLRAGAAGAAGSMALMAQAADGGKRTRAQGGIRLGNLFFSSGLTGVRPEVRKDPLAFGGDIKEQTERILQAQKANLEALGSSLENVLKVTVFLAD